MLRSVAPRARYFLNVRCGVEHRHKSAIALVDQATIQAQHTRSSMIESLPCSQSKLLHTCTRKASIPNIFERNLRYRRQFSFSARTDSNAFHAIAGYAFAGKPRTQKAEEEMQQQFTGTLSSNPQSVADSTSRKQPSRQGFPPDSAIGRWVDATLKEGEAGEDAILYEKMKGQGDVVFGVSDGVGGWSEEGIDPALFSQSLMFHSAQYAKQFHACPERLESEEQDDVITSSLQNRSKSDGTPRSILEYAYERTLKEDKVPAGSATACILTFDASKGTLRAANLGDSGFLILRPLIGSEHDSTTAVKLSVHHQSKAQVFGFNAPFQLSKLPMEYQSDAQISCTPERADLWKDRLMDGDLVLVATDGFWDNVSVSEVLQLVQFIKEKHRAAFVEKMLDISNNPLAEEEDLATVLAHK